MHKVCSKINEKYVDEEGILRIKVLEGVTIDLASLKEDLLLNQRLTGGRKVCVLYDARPSFKITVEAREYLQSKAFNEERLATAVISNRAGVRAMVNFMVHIRKNHSPLKMFSNEVRALDWLRKIQSLN